VGVKTLKPMQETMVMTPDLEIPVTEAKPAAARPPVVVDARMLKFSGIGVYVNHVLREFQAMDIPFAFAANPWTEELDGRPPEYDFHARVYSVKEQIAFKRLGITRDQIWWSPHYNIPLFHRGTQVTTIHDLAHLALPQFFGAWKKQLYSKLMFEAAARKSHSIICVSQFTADELLRLTGADHRKLHVIHNGVDEKWFDPEHGERPSERPYLLHVGNVKAHKNFQRLIEAFKKIQGRYDVDLMLVGRKEGFLAGDSAELDMTGVAEGRLQFTGHVSDSLLRRYYAHAEALVFPSLYEGFGLPPLEAMASGCPVVASHAASIPEVCGEAAIYCDPLSVDDIADKIKLALELKGNERHTLLENARTHAARFSWKRCARQTWEILQNAGA
jgi:glycosyltransferase involved in cell wall biosynthesis